jgi:hypothetical protein
MTALATAPASCTRCGDLLPHSSTISEALCLFPHAAVITGRGGYVLASMCNPDHLDRGYVHLSLHTSEESLRREEQAWGQHGCRVGCTGVHVVHRLSSWSPKTITSEGNAQ